MPGFQKGSTSYAHHDVGSRQYKKITHLVSDEALSRNSTVPAKYFLKQKTYFYWIPYYVVVPISC